MDFNRVCTWRELTPDRIHTADSRRRVISMVSRLSNSRRDEGRPDSPQALILTFGLVRWKQIADNGPQRPAKQRVEARQRAFSDRLTWNEEQRV